MATLLPAQASPQAAPPGAAAAGRARATAPESNPLAR